MTAMFWDEPKRVSNIEDHHLHFADARDRFGWDTAIIVPSHPGRDRRPRLKALGYLDGRLVGLVFAPLGTEAISAVSLRPANRSERNDMPKAKRRTLPTVTDAEEARIQAGIATDPDNPEWTDEDFARAKPASEVLPPALYAALTRPRGRPRAAETKQEVKLRLDRKAVETFKRSGPGWQTRMNDAIVRAAHSLAQVPAGRETAAAIETSGEGAAKTESDEKASRKRISSRP